MSKLKIKALALVFALTLIGISGCGIRGKDKAPAGKEETPREEVTSVVPSPNSHASGEGACEADERTEEKDSARIVMVGDILLHDKILSWASDGGANPSYDFSPIFDGTRDLSREAS